MAITQLDIQLSRTLLSSSIEAALGRTLYRGNPKIDLTGISEVVIRRKNQIGLGFRDGSIQTRLDLQVDIRFLTNLLGGLPLIGALDTRKLTSFPVKVRFESQLGWSPSFHLSSQTQCQVEWGTIPKVLARLQPGLMEQIQALANKIDAAVESIFALPEFLPQIWPDAYQLEPPLPFWFRLQVVPPFGIGPIQVQVAQLESFIQGEAGLQLGGSKLSAQVLPISVACQAAPQKQPLSTSHAYLSLEPAFIRQYILPLLQFSVSKQSYQCTALSFSVEAGKLFFRSSWKTNQDSSLEAAGQLVIRNGYWHISQCRFQGKGWRNKVMGLLSRIFPKRILPRINQPFRQEQDRWKEIVAAQLALIQPNESLEIESRLQDMIPLGFQEQGDSLDLQYTLTLERLCLRILALPAFELKMGEA